MRFREALQVQLQERYRRLYKSDWRTFEDNVRFTLDWFDSVPALKSIVDSLRRSNPDFDPVEWWEEVSRRRAIPKPPTEEARAKVVLHGLHEIAYVDGVDFTQMFHALTSKSNYDEMIRDFCSQWVEPVIEQLHARLGAESDVLYLLERYRRGTAWFNQGALYERYLADTARGEAMYEKDLRRFLFEQGIDYPFSQPESPSGKADVIAQVDSDDPLACEVKLYDGDAYGVSYLAKGLGQARRYAEDYGKAAGYLAIFNLSDHSLDLPSDDPEAGWPPRISVGGITVFLVLVQAKPMEVASKAGRAKTVKVSRQKLVQELS